MTSRATRKRIARIRGRFGMQQCSGKIVHKTKEAAHTAGRKLKLRVYECEVCTWWHLAS